MQFIPYRDKLWRDSSKILVNLVNLENLDSSKFRETTLEWNLKPTRWQCSVYMANVKQLYYNGSGKTICFPSNFTVKVSNDLDPAIKNKASGKGLIIFCERKTFTT